MPQRIIFPSRGEVVLQDFELPNLGSTDLQVRTKYSLMSIGTETIILHQRYDPGTHFDKLFSFPQLQTGVQAVAQIEVVGSAVTEFSPGQHVFMRLAHGSQQVLAAADCSLVPEGNDLKRACWCGLAKTAFRAAWAGPLHIGGNVLIIGAGPVGQMIVRWAKSAGVQEIAVADLSGFRLEHARRGGATITFNQDAEACLPAFSVLNNGTGPDIVIDTTGNPKVFQYALAAAALFGKVIVLGDTGYPSRQCLSSEAMTKGLTIQATHDSHDVDGWTQRRVDRLFFDLVEENRFDLSGLITHEFSPKDCQQAYQLADNQREQTLGILYDWR